MMRPGLLGNLFSNGGDLAMQYVGFCIARLPLVLQVND